MLSGLAEAVLRGYARVAWDERGGIGWFGEVAVAGAGMGTMYARGVGSRGQAATQ